MIDFFKSNHLAIGLGIKRLLDFPMSIEEGTGQVLNGKQSAKLRNLVFTITPGEYPKVKAQGSVHKYYNQGLHNYNRFTLSRFRETVAELSAFISPQDRVNVLEFGINLLTPFNPSDFIGHLIAHKGVAVNKTKLPGEHYSEVRRSQYKIKIYHKGLQFSQGNILRIELRYDKMENLFPGGLAWGDLCEQKIWENLGERLISAFKELIYYDPSIDLSVVTSDRDKSLLIEGNNPIFWEKQQGPHISRIRTHFQKTVRKYGNTFTLLPDLIRDELVQLIDIDHLDEMVSSDRIAIPVEGQGMVSSDQFLVNKKTTSISGTYKKVVSSDTLLYGQKSPTSKSHTSVGLNIMIPELRKYCPVTGLDITNQKTESRFLSIAGLKKLQIADPKMFSSIRHERMSSKWTNFPVDVQIREIAHSIRNEYFNPKNNARKAVDNVLNHPALFDQRPFINPRKLVLAGLSASV